MFFSATSRHPLRSSLAFVSGEKTNICRGDRSLLQVFQSFGNLPVPSSQRFVLQSPVSRAVNSYPLKGNVETKRKKKSLSKCNIYEVYMYVCRYLCATQVYKISDRFSRRNDETEFTTTCDRPFKRIARRELPLFRRRPQPPPRRRRRCGERAWSSRGDSVSGCRNSIRSRAIGVMPSAPRRIF